MLQAAIGDLIGGSAVFEGCCFVIDLDWPWCRLLLQKGVLLPCACYFLSLPACSVCSSCSLHIMMAGGELVLGNWLSWKLVLIIFFSRMRSLLQVSAQLCKGICEKITVSTISVEAHACQVNSKWLRTMGKGDLATHEKQHFTQMLSTVKLENGIQNCEGNTWAIHKICRGRLRLAVEPIF